MSSLSKFAPERLRQELTIGEAACLWTDLPFAILEDAITKDGVPHHPDHPELRVAAEALVEATDCEDIRTQRNEDGYPVDPKYRLINRHDLKHWLGTRHPDHKPTSLFGTASLSEAIKPATPSVALPKNPQTTKPLPTAAAQPVPLPPTIKRIEGVIDLKEVEQLTKLKKTAIYDLMKKGDFPKKILLGPKRAVWDKVEILEWLEARRKGG